MLGTDTAPFIGVCSFCHNIIENVSVYCLGCQCICWFCFCWHCMDRERSQTSSSRFVPSV